MVPKFLPPSKPTKASVLIVDDDADIRHVLRLLVEFENFQIAGEASSGTEALALALRRHPDLIVLDYMMPGMPGDKAAKALRSMLPKARIVAFSAILEERPAWADAFLNKARITEIAPLLSDLVAASGTA